MHQLLYALQGGNHFSFVKLNLTYIPLCHQDPRSLRSDLGEGRCDQDSEPAVASGPGAEGRAEFPQEPFKQSGCILKAGGLDALHQHHQ